MSKECNRKRGLAGVKEMTVKNIVFLHVDILQYNAGPSLQVSAQKGLESHFNSPSPTEMRLVLHSSLSLSLSCNK